jgi:hypothetical protein
MAACTFTLPSGATIKTRTNRVYALIMEHPDTAKPWVEQRSDSPGTLDGVVRRMRRAGSRSRFYIGDTITGKLTADYQTDSTIEATSSRTVLPAYSWSVSSALWQVKNGEGGTDRTRSAAVFLEWMVSADGDAAKTIAMDLLLYIPVMRADNEQETGR